MNLKELKKIVNSDTPDDVKEHLVIVYLANQDDFLPKAMKILAVERKQRYELINDINAELSRAHVYIDENPEVPRNEKKRFNKNFVMDQIAAFYIKNKGKVIHVFNRFND